MTRLLLLAVLAAKPPFLIGFAARQAGARYCCAPATLAGAKPVAKQYKGPLDTVDTRGQSAGVLARFDGTDRAGAEQAITEVARALSLSDQVRVSFIRTDAGPLAALTLDAASARLAFAAYTHLGLELSKRDGVAETWAFIAPGPRDDALEQEATFRFVHGEPRGERRALYRDDAAYVDHVRRKTSPATFHAGRWPDYPLSQLATALKLPGRGCLDSPWHLQTLSTTRWPIDVGDDLSLAWVELPGAVATEIQQLAVKEGRSTSNLVTEALRHARTAKVLAQPTGDFERESKARRPLTLFLPAELLETTEDLGAAEAVSLSRIVEYAWVRAHPVVSAAP